MYFKDLSKGEKAELIMDYLEGTEIQYYHSMDEKWYDVPCFEDEVVFNAYGRYRYKDEVPFGELSVEDKVSLCEAYLKGKTVTFCKEGSRYWDYLPEYSEGMSVQFNPKTRYKIV